jgi:hypothetical protein
MRTKFFGLGPLVIDSNSVFSQALSSVAGPRGTARLSRRQKGLELGVPSWNMGVSTGP